MAGKMHQQTPPAAIATERNSYAERGRERGRCAIHGDDRIDRRRYKSARSCASAPWRRYSGTSGDSCGITAGNDRLLPSLPPTHLSLSLQQKFGRQMLESTVFALVQKVNDITNVFTRVVQLALGACMSTAPLAFYARNFWSGGKSGITRALYRGSINSAEYLCEWSRVPMKLCREPYIEKRRDFELRKFNWDLLYMQTFRYCHAIP